MIRTRYYGPTNLQGTRIVANDGNGHRLTHHRDYSKEVYEDHRAAAVALASRLDWPSTDLSGGHWNGDYFWRIRECPE